MQIPFFLLNKFFGNPLAFRALAFITHTINIVLVFVLIFLLSKKKFESLLVSFLYATSTVGYIPFFWSATYAFIAGPTAFLASFVLFVIFCRKKRKVYLSFSFVSFFLGLLINEIVVVLPAILFFYIFIFKERRFVKYLLPYFLSGAIFFLVRFVLFRPPLSGLYHIEIGKHIFTNLEAYLLWSFNWPVEMKAQLINFYTFNPQFIADFSVYFRVFVSSLFISLFSFYILPLIFIICRKETYIKRIIVFGFVWFIIGLIPVIFFPSHSFPYYLVIPLVGLLFLSVSLFGKLLRVVSARFRWLSYLFISIVLVNWFFVAKTTVDFNSKIHWAPRRAKIAKRLIEKARKYYKYPFEDYCIYVGKTSENKWALNDQDAFRLIYGDDRIKTIYTDETERENVL